MAEETKTPGGNEPSKIRLNPGKTGNGDTDKIKMSSPGQTPPKIQLRAADAKKSTTRIDLADVKPPPMMGDDIRAMSAEKQAEFFKKSTIRIEQSAPQQVEVKRATIRVDQVGGPAGDTQQMASGETARIEAKKSTLRIDQPTVGATQPVQNETSKIDVKRSTIRIESGTETQKVQGETGRIDVKKSTIRIDGIPKSGSADTQRTGGETRRIDLKTVETGQMAPAPSEQGVILPSVSTGPKLTDTQQQKLKKETTRLEIPPEVIKRQTGKIQTGPVVEPPDVFKKRTGKFSTAPVAMPPVVPVTPTAPPPVVPTSGSDTVSRPKTILVRRPQRPGGEAPMRPAAVTQVLAEATAQARKSETARLEIPKDVGAEDRPTTRPKTIRIKRPDVTTARKQLTIARPTAEGEEVAAMPEGLRAPAPVVARTAEPGGVWTILAIAATLVIGAVIYVLLTQSPSPFTHWVDLPFPGKTG